MLDYIKKHGVIQLLNIYNERKDWNYRVLLWGDEIEYLVIKVDPAARSAKLSLRGHELLPVLQEPERDNPSTAASLWRPEYGRSVARRRQLVRSTHCFSSARWRLRFCVTLCVARRRCVEPIFRIRLRRACVGGSIDGVVFSD